MTRDFGIEMADSLAGASSTQPKPAYSRFAQEPSNADDAQPPAYNSLPPSSDPPPAYASLFPERVLHRLPAPIRPARPPTRHERHSSLIKCGVLLLLFAVQCAVIGLAAKGTQKFGRVFAPSAETDIGLVVLLVASVAEVGFAFLIAPCFYCIGRGAGYYFSFVLLALDMIGTSGFLFYCIRVDADRSTCSDQHSPMRQRECDEGVVLAIATGVLRVLVTAPCCLYIFIVFARGRWGHRIRQRRPLPASTVG